MRRSRRGAALGLLLLIFSALAGCSNPLMAGVAARPTATSTPLPMPTSLHVVRTSDFAENNIAPFETTVSDADKVERLYLAIYALPIARTVASGTPSNCYVDYGITYHLSFLVGKTPAKPITADPGGCQWVIIDAHDVRDTNDAFWTLMGQTLGLTHDDLFPQPSRD